MKRIFLIVLDSFGIGEAPDAHEFGDTGANTLKSIFKTGKLKIPNLLRLGLGNINGVDFLEKENSPTAVYAKLRELSRGKDTTTGHWEIAGTVSNSPMPTFPNGFPKEIIEEFETAIGRKTLCNKVYSGTEVIKDYGEEHLRTGFPIIYTSADSVFQIAAHEEVVPVDTLYDFCKKAREILMGEYAVGRVIARPFIGDKNGYKRTSNRHDFSLIPPKKTILDAIKDSGLDVIAVGKINDIFASQGITEAIPTKSNEDGINKTKELTRRDFKGLAFVNLVDFDSAYGHRQDADGYASAMSYFDERLPEILSALNEDDALIITADHGCDPSDNSTDHTREYVPFLLYRKKAKALNLGTLSGFGFVSHVISKLLSVNFTPDACENYEGIKL